MNKKISFFVGIFGGLCFALLGGYLLWTSIRKTQTYMASVGTVVDVATYRNPEGKILYAPVLRFNTPDGLSHQFTSNIYSGGFRPMVGEKQPILYDPAWPERAIKNEVFSLYVFPSLFLSAGFLILFAVIVLPQIITMRHARREKRLRAIGRPVQARIQGVFKTGFSEDRVPMYEIRAQYLDQTSNILHEYNSFSLSYDPTIALQNHTEVTVYVNPADQTDYWMDTSFLPRMEAKK